jgi:FkbM family methyltransferase
LLACCVRLLPTEPTVLDVGANIGLALLPLAAAARERGGFVHAFEPLPANLDVLNKNVALNNMESDVKTWPFGLSSEHGQAEISLREDFVAGGASGNASLVISSNDAHFATQMIELRTLDEVYETLGCKRIDFIKVDIEGHEDHFLRGAQTMLARDRPILMMEINKPYYARRDVDLDLTLPTLLEGFTILRSEGGRYKHWLQMTSVTECQRLDNVFVVPQERVTRSLATLNAS